MYFLRTYPVVRILIFFIVGLLLPNFQLSWLIAVLVLFTAITLIGYYQKYGLLYKTLPWCIVALLGNLVATLHNTQVDTSLNDSEAYVAQIITRPEQKPKSIKATAKVLKYKIQGEWINTNQEVLLYFINNSYEPSFEEVFYIKNSPREIEGPKNPEEFNYKLFQKRKGILAHHFLREGDFQIIGVKPLRWHLRLAFAMNQYAEDVFRKFIHSKDEYAVAQAMIVGQKEDLSLKLRQSYATAGAVHILAVSGLHVGILFLLLGFVFNWMSLLPKGDLIKTIVIVLLLWLYALFTGFSPSVTRATLMFSVIQIGLIARRDKNTINVVAFSALLLLTIQPKWIYEVGFQLSYLAVLGIVILYPYLNRLWQPKWKVLQYLWQLSAVSICAQLFTFPLSVYYFHQFPSYFLFTNPIVSILSTIILFCGIGLLLLSWVPYLGELVAYILDKALHALNFMVEWVEKLPYSKLSGLYFERLEVLCVYVLITLFLIFFIRKYLMALKVGVAIALCFLAFQLYQSHLVNGQKKLVIHYVPKSTAISIIDQNKSTLIADSSLLNDDRAFGFHFKNYYDAMGINTYEKVAQNFSQSETIQFGNETILWLKGSKHAMLKEPFEKVLISGKSLKDIRKQFKALPAHIILDDTVPFYLVKSLKQQCEELQITCTSLYESGALVYDL